jgi:hypothetical protein
LTTAIFLLLLGSIVEYSPRTDGYILAIIIWVFIGKMNNGYVLYERYATGATTITAEAAGLTKDSHVENGMLRWFGIYAWVPWEVFFAVADSIKYVQVVYIAKWMDRRFMMVPFSFWFILMGMAQWPQYFYTLNVDKTDHAHRDQEVDFYEAIQSFITGGVLLFLGIIQCCFFTMDPTDSNLIIFEQCMNLSSIYSLPQVKDVMHKEQFLKLVDRLMEIKYGRHIVDQGEQSRRYEEMKQIKKQEEIDRILNKSKSVSVYDLFQIRNVSRITLCALCMTVNVYITRVIYKNVFSMSEYNPDGRDCIAKNITNTNFMIGIVMLILAFLANTKFFSGRRMSLILFTIIILTCWNVIWISFSNIQTIEDENEKNQLIEKRVYYYKDLNENKFDLVMFLG